MAARLRISPTTTSGVDWTGYYVPATDGTIRIGISGDDGYRISVTATGSILLTPDSFL